MVNWSRNPSANKTSFTLASNNNFDYQVNFRFELFGSSYLVLQRLATALSLKICPKVSDCTVVHSHFYRHQRITVGMILLSSLTRRLAIGARPLSFPVKLKVGNGSHQRLDSANTNVHNTPDPKSRRL